ncbi:MAG: class I SAM-dependent methyltransferase [Mycobacterium sp.]|nr:class I SAM-dependent methyltransferase [Mycobacterium sp.]
MGLTRRLPFLRWSFLRMGLSVRRISTSGQVGDGREAAAIEYVLAHSSPGNIDEAVRAFDDFAYSNSFLINIGDEKGRLLDAAITRTDPHVVLELGTYCGYSALRMASAAPRATIVSVELSAANAANARRIWAHAGIGDRVTCVQGTVGDGGRTLDTIAGILDSRPVDFLFIDHDKDAYLPDLVSILERGWLRAGSVALADNMGLPGSPKYLRYMRELENRQWRTVEHKTHVEYQTMIPDLVLESDYLGG